MVRSVGLLIAFSLFANSTPAAPKTLLDIATSTKADLTLWMQLNDVQPRLASLLFGDEEKGGKQEKQFERDARVSRIEILPGDVTVQEGQKINFTAVTFDRDNNPVGGVKIRWSARDDGRARDIFINQRGDFAARAEGSYRVTAEAAGQRAVVNVTVHEGIRKRRGDDVPIKVRTTSSRDLPPEADQALDQNKNKRNQAVPANARLKGSSNKSAAGEFSHAAKTKSSKRSAAAAPAAYFLNDGWGSDNYWSADDPINRRGNPPGSAVDEGAGSSNFRFDAPVAFIPGRGIDLALSLTYNSRLWNKAGNNINYDIDRDWPAPGFNLGFGKLAGLGVYIGGIMIDGDGTRHPYAGTVTEYNWGTTFFGHTTDGTLVDYQYVTGTNGIMLWGQATYPNGTRIDYNTNGPAGLYPTRITDPNGNYMTITYVNNSGPRIQTVTDTMGRFINFHYDTGNRLTAITSPGLGGGTRTLVRLHYSQLSLSYSFVWPNVGITREAAPWVIDAIYYPGSNTGYWMGLSDNSYSTYGMLKKVSQRRGMSFSGQDPVPPGQGTTDQGTITAGTVTNEEVYNYPLNTSDTTGTQASSLSDAPTFTSCIESWTRDGTSTMDQAVTAYEITQNSTQRIVTITQPNSTVTTQYSHNLPGNFLDGLIFLDETKSGTTVLQSSSTTWASGAYDSPRATEVLITNQNNQTTKTTFSYGSYNQVTEVKTFDYGGTSLLTATRTQYQNSTNYTNRHIFNLPLVVEVFASDDTTRVSRTEFQYDGQTLTDTPDVIMHDDASNPYAQTQESCDWVCYEYDPWWVNCINWQWVCNYYNPYDPATDFRGNMTQVTTYADAINLTGSVTETRRYDKTGNLVTSSNACCQQTSFEYTVNTQYAYPQTQKRGSSTDALHQVSSSSTFDFNTGVALTQTDANGRAAQITYDAVTLRPVTMSLPAGGHIDYLYDDANLSATQTNYLQSHATHTTIAEQNVRLRNGRDQIRQEKALAEGGVFDIVDTLYNSMGDVTQQSRPYRNGDTIRWNTTTYDALQRAISIQAADGSTIQSFYNESNRPSAASSAPGETMRTVDAWGRERWGRSNSLGRLVEVVEPDQNGSGSVATNGMVTTYAYDTLGNLTTVTQGSQTRSLKYDALGRLTAQKLAERNATLDNSGNYVGIGGSGAQWSDFFRYDSRSNLVQYRDARGVKVNYWFFDRTGYTDPGDVNATRDPLNRLQSITYDTTADPNYSLTPGHPNYYLKVLAAATISFQYRTKSSGSELKDVTQPEVITTDQTSTESLHYDTLGRVDIRTLTVNGRTSFPFVTNYTYDTLERTTDVQYPAEYGNGTGPAPRRTAHQNYDVASRLISLTMNGQTQTSNVVYNPASQITSLKVGVSGTNQITENYSYSDLTGLLEGQTITRNGSTLLNLSYDHANSQGKRTGQLVKLLNNLDHTKDRAFEYDALGRLKRATGGQSVNWVQRYEYDRYGNRNNVFSYNAEQYVRNFFQNALNRQPNSTELSTWLSTLQTAYSQGPTQFLTAMQNLGEFIFTHAEYNEPNDREYVKDLYRTYLFRESDQGGEDSWTQNVPIIGRAAVRGGFAWSVEFNVKVNAISPYAHPNGNQVPIDGWDGIAFEPATNRILNAGWTYDASGNQTRVMVGASTWQAFQYDAANRLVRVLADDKTTVIASYTYGADRQRLISYEPSLAGGQGLRTYYVEEGGSVSAEYTEVGSSTSPVWSKSYVYFAGRLLSTLTPNSGGALVDYHHPDRLGTRLVSNAQNTSYFEQVALPFGTAFGLESSVNATSRRFTTYDRSVTTGLDYASNRFYDPKQGRFSQVDPIAMDSVNLTNPQTLNLYAYCINDPVNLVDPSGLGFLSFLKKIFVRGLKAVIAAAVAFVVTFVQTGSFDRAKAAAKQAFIDNFVQIPRRRIGTPPTFPVGIGRPPLHEIFRGTILSKLFPAPAELLKWTHIGRFQAVRNDCLAFADFADRAAKESWTDRGFARRLWGRYAENAPPNSDAAREFDDSGFRGRFQGSVSPNQSRHVAGVMWHAFTNGQLAFHATLAASPVWWGPSLAGATRIALNRANAREVNDDADVRLNSYAVAWGVRMAYGYTNRFAVAAFIRKYLCGSGW